MTALIKLYLWSLQLVDTKDPGILSPQKSKSNLPGPESRLQCLASNQRRKKYKSVFHGPDGDRASLEPFQVLPK